MENQLHVIPNIMEINGNRLLSYMFRVTFQVLLYDWYMLHCFSGIFRQVEIASAQVVAFCHSWGIIQKHRDKFMKAINSFVFCLILGSEK